jgi:hypothetical protein
VVAVARELEADRLQSGVVVGAEGGLVEPVVFGIVHDL